MIDAAVRPVSGLGAVQHARP